MMEEQTQKALQERQWIVVKDVTLMPQKVPVVELWKQYANGVAIALSIQCEGDQFVLYQDVGHVAGTNRTNCGTFSTANAAIHQLIEASYSWDDTWGM